MNNHIFKSLLFFILLSMLSCERKHKSERQLVQVNQAQTINSPTGTGTVPVDIANSGIRWKGTKMGGLRSHEGTLKLKEGHLIFKDDALIGGYFIADMNAIWITDIPADDPIPIRNLTKHLKTEFNSQKYPTSKFVISRVEYLKADSLTVQGSMTIREVTKNISIPVVIDLSEGSHRKFHTVFKLDRLAWNIGAEGSWLEKRVVDKEFVLSVEIVVHQQ